MKLNINTRKILSESLTIVLSVLFALFINEWRNSYNTKQQTNIILKNVFMEIEENHQLTNKHFEHHNKILSSLVSLTQQDSLRGKIFSNNQIDFSYITTKPFFFKNYNTIAWEVAKEEKISSRIDFTVSKQLFEIYALQKTINQTGQRIISIITSREIYRKELVNETLNRLLNEFNELTAQEEHLLQLFKKIKMATEDFK